MKMKPKIAWVAAAFVFAGGACFLAGRSVSRQYASPAPAAGQIAATSTLTGDGQVIEISVKEGYQPKEITAQAGVPLVLKMKTQGTFDCSTSFSIPKLGLQARLQPTGESDFNIPAQKAGDSVYGVCSMGMYTFIIKFAAERVPDKSD